jgi:glucose/arabinose dehydrogenase
MLPVAALLCSALFTFAGCGEQRTTGEAAARTGLKLVKVGSFENPVHATSHDRRHLYVVEQEGRIIVQRKGKRRTFLDIRGKATAGAEQGLLSVAFAPDFRESRRFYVYYTDNAADQRVAEFTARSAVRARPGSERLVLRMADNESNHNGGLLQFHRGDLYIGTGDGGGGGDRHGRIGNAQDTGSLLGKILRIVPRPEGRRAYGIPDDNPFVGRAGRDEIFAYGLRNPWRFDFDRNGDLSIGDVGQDALEEIDYVPAGRASGANFGWRVFEGDRVFAPGEEAPGHVGPVLTFSHDDGWCSITGGVFVRDRRVPGAFGRYLFGDFCKGQVLSADLTADDPQARGTGLRVDGLSSFGEDARGRVFVTSLNGPVYRLAAK